MNNVPGEAGSVWRSGFERQTTMLPVANRQVTRAATGRRTDRCRAMTIRDRLWANSRCDPARRHPPRERRGLVRPSGAGCWRQADDMLSSCARLQPAGDFRLPVGTGNHRNDNVLAATLNLATIDANMTGVSVCRRVVRNQTHAAFEEQAKSPKPSLPRRARRHRVSNLRLPEHRQ